MKIGVIVPHAGYRGGILKYTGDLLQLLANMSVDENSVVSQLVVGISSSSKEDLRAWRSVVPASAEIREIQFDSVHLADEALDVADIYSTRSSAMKGNDFAVVRDGILDFSDCDLWLQITNRIVVDSDVLPLLPLRPTVLFPFDAQEAIWGSGDASRTKQLLRASSFATCVIVNSNRVKSDLAAFAGIGLGNIRVIPHFPQEMSHDCEQSKDFPELANEKYVMWGPAGSFAENREIVLQAMVHARSELKNLRLRVFGPGSTAIGHEFDHDWITVEGYVPEHYLHALYRHATVSLVTSMGGAGSFDLLEAKAHSCPSVVVEDEGNKEFAASVYTSPLWFTANRPEELSNQLVLAAGKRHRKEKKPSTERESTISEIRALLEETISELT